MAGGGGDGGGQGWLVERPGRTTGGNNLYERGRKTEGESAEKGTERTRLDVRSAGNKDNSMQ